MCRREEGVFVKTYGKCVNRVALLANNETYVQVIGEDEFIRLVKEINNVPVNMIKDESSD